MVISDPIYGEFDITEPVLLELLEEPAVLRAGKIMQGSTTAIINGWKDFSRLEHCIGVMLFIRKLGGSLDEQIAGLIHDISHTAFSHVIDFVYSRESTHDYHEYIKEKIIRNSTIPDIINKYGHNIDFILDENNFGILERSAPDLCADRIDYTLRSLWYYYNDIELARYLAGHFILVHGEIVFDSPESALTFAKAFHSLMSEVVSHDKNVAAYFVFADALRRSIERKYLSEDDFLMTDEYVYAKLSGISDVDIRRLLDCLTTSFRIEYGEGVFCYLIKTKARWVNPKFMQNGVHRAFDLSSEMGSLVEAYKEHLKNPIPVTIVNL